MNYVTASDCDLGPPIQDASVNETGNISSQPESDPTAHITNADIDRVWASQREELAAPISKLSSFRGHESFRSLMRSLLKVGQLEKGKKTRAGKTFIGNEREAACELLGIPFEFEQTDYGDDDAHVIEAGTDSNAERRRETQGQAICTAVRTRLYHEEIQKQRPFHQVPTYEWLAQKFVGSKRSHRSVRDARKILDLCPELFACVERDYVTVAGAKRLLDKVDKAKWPEIVRSLHDDRDADHAADACDGEQDVQSRGRRRGDKRIAPFLPGSKKKAVSSKLNKARRTRPIVQDGSLRNGDDASAAGLNDSSTAAIAQDQHDDLSDTGAGDTGPGDIVGAALPIDALQGNTSLCEPAPKRDSGADDATTVNLGVFTASLTALNHLQDLLRTYRATLPLIDALETTLNAARESVQ